MNSTWPVHDKTPMLGSTLLGLGATLTALNCKSAGERTSQRGRILLKNMPAMPHGLENAVKFPLLEALHGRRARRFSLGASIPDGPTTYTSKHKPMPLSELEQLMVLTAVGANTNVFPRFQCIRWYGVLPADNKS